MCAGLRDAARQRPPAQLIDPREPDSDPTAIARVADEHHMVRKLLRRHAWHSEAVVSPTSLADVISWGQMQQEVAWQRVSWRPLYT